MNTVTFGLVVAAAFAISYTVVSYPEKKQAAEPAPISIPAPAPLAPIVKAPAPSAADIYYATPREAGWAERERLRNTVQRRIDRPVSCSSQILRTRSTVQVVQSCN